MSAQQSETVPLVTLTYEQTLEGLRQVVARKGEDYIYPHAGEQCVYFAGNGRPSCLVGHLLADLGVRKADLGTSNLIGVHSLITNGVVAADQRTEALLAAVQDMQDAGTNWGQAVQWGQIEASVEVTSAHSDVTENSYTGRCPRPGCPQTYNGPSQVRVRRYMRSHLLLDRHETEPETPEG